MASAAVENSMAEPSYGPISEPIFTSSDLPLTSPYIHTNDLFVNPAFAHMNFLSDGSMVGPSGEIYSPAEYFPSLMVEHSQEVPAVIPVSPQPGEYPPGAATPPPGKNKGFLWF